MTQYMCFISHVACHFCLYFLSPPEEEGEDEDVAAFHEQLTEIEEEQFPDEEGEEEGEEGEEEARERMKGALIEKFEEQNEAISALQVS